MSWNILLLADAAAGQPDPMPQLVLWMMIIGGFMYFMVIRPQRREQKEKDALLSALKKDDRVVTTGGMFGTIASIKDDEVTLRIDDKAKVQVRFQKAAIARVITGKDDDSESKPPAGPDAPKS